MLKGFSNPIGRPVNIGVTAYHRKYPARDDKNPTT
jgi:hypothetical protein